MLRINEIYPAICGESRFSGRPCALVRLTGCHLRCAWCDTPHSFAGGLEMTVDGVLEEVRALGLSTVLVTGGEPLLQIAVVGLLKALLDDGRTVLLETSGADPGKLVPLREVPAGVHRVVDLKAPLSGIDTGLIDWEGIGALGPGDDVKVVIAGRPDFDWAVDILRDGTRIPTGVRVAFSAAAPLLDPATLATWMLDEGVEATFQLQLHKALWPDRERGV